MERYRFSPNDRAMLEHVPHSVAMGNAPEELKRMVDMPPYQLSEIVHDEFLRCFERKN